MFRFTSQSLVFGALAAVVAASSPIGSEPPRTNDEIIRELNELTRIEFRETPIRAGAEFLAAQHSIPVNVDKSVGDVAITLKLDRVKLRDALKLMLDPHGLEYAVVSGTVLIRAKMKP